MNINNNNNNNNNNNKTVRSFQPCTAHTATHRSTAGCQGGRSLRGVSGQLIITDMDGS